jgi:hypothetical protein
MNDGAKPQLALGTPPGKLKAAGGGGLGRWWLLSIVLQGLTLVLIVLLIRQGTTPNTPLSNTAASIAGGEDPRAVALALEDRSLDLQAAEAWRQYLQQNPAATDRAEVLYRMGKLYLNAEQYGDGAAALVRAEQAAGDNEDLKAKIGPQLITCLRRLGRYGEVGRELSRQIEAGASDVGQGKVLATVAGESLTDADLDRMVEQRVDQQLRMAGAGEDESTRQMLLKRFAEPSIRQQLLTDLLRRELFTRRARELELDQTEDFARQRQMLEDDLLADRFEQQKLAPIQPTRVDLESFYAARREGYVEPESAECTFFELEPDERAEDVLKDVESADDFRQVAAERDEDAGDAPAGPETVVLVRGREHPVLGDVEAVFDLDAGSWTSKPLSNGERRFMVLIEKKTPARTPEFDEVASRVEAEYRNRKRQEVLERTFQELMVRYDVKLQPQATRDAPASSPEDNIESDE